MPRTFLKLVDGNPEKPDPNKLNEPYKHKVLDAFDSLDNNQQDDKRREFKDIRAEVEWRCRKRL